MRARTAAGGRCFPSLSSRISNPRQANASSPPLPPQGGRARGLCWREWYSSTLAIQSGLPRILQALCGAIAWHLPDPWPAIACHSLARPARVPPATGAPTEQHTGPTQLRAGRWDPQPA